MVPARTICNMYAYSVSVLAARFKLFSGILKNTAGNKIFSFTVKCLFALV